MIGGLHDEQEPQGEERCEYDAHRCAFVHLAEAADPLGEDCREHADNRSTDKHGQTGARLRH